ncbi:L,D-transpeptidase family protein [Alteraurantiacibacter buctensis]|uniref:L,D-transpeptidase family protein n=1 Tax=Alteraurantiacibacter buctensis TaxID=1503981 RepID=A0A844YXE6_9SPHN|nr:L,D-transpeptidase family protein [Alteraurantiacibacter buctensis]MXO71648.1 L,D-transpeptidase family protein [Alteraurantiacibacter buctensis]
MRSFQVFVGVAALSLLAGCGLNGTDRNRNDHSEGAPEDAGLADSMRSDDDVAQTLPDSQPRPVMQLQVVLDRLGFTPGVVDGKEGFSTTNAISAFQESRGLAASGELDEETRRLLQQWETIPATRVVTIPENWGSLTFQPVPEGAAEQAQMDSLGYESLDEKLAERFHTTVEVLRELNPGGRPAGADNRAATPAPRPSASASAATPAPLFRAGQQIRVPNIGADAMPPGSVENREWQRTLASLGVGSRQPAAARIVVDESEKMLRAYDADDRLVAAFTVSSGSANDPLPIGEWGINGVAYNPPFTYQPDLFWDVPDSEEEQQLPPGPNGPVGVVWIDLTKEHYGIHGTPEPQTIGRAQSHGCVRLTNWDAARLAGMVSGSTKVVFQR